MLSALLVTVSAFSQETKAIHHWTGNVDGQALDLTLAERSDGLLAGTLVKTEGGSTSEFAVYGFSLKDTPGNLLMDAYAGCDVSYSLPGKITDAGDYDCWFVPVCEDGTQVVLKKAAAPQNFRDPFKHATFQELGKVSEYYRSKQTSREDSDISSLVTMSDKGKLIFTIDVPNADHKFGELYIGDDEMNADAEFLPYKDGIVDLTVYKLSYRLEFFKDFVYVKRTSRFNPADDMSMDFTKAEGFYILQTHFSELPVWWYEGEGEDSFEYEPQFTEVGALLNEMTCCGSDYWMREGAIKVDYAGTRPNIEDYFKAFHKKYQGAIVDKTSDIIYGVTAPTAESNALLDKRHGFLKSDIEGHYFEGMQMCYWKTPTDHDIVAVRINYTGLGQFDAFNSTLLILYEFDTEKHLLRPMSVGGYHRWAISDAYLLPENLKENANIQLPQEGKDIIYYEGYAPDIKKQTLRWNGEWFDY